MRWGEWEVVHRWGKLRPCATWWPPLQFLATALLLKIFSANHNMFTKSRTPAALPLWEKVDAWDVLGSCHQQTDSLSNWHFHLETQHGLAKATNRRENHSRSDSICVDTYIMVGWNFGCASITLHTHIFSHASMGQVFLAESDDAGGCKGQFKSNHQD